MIPLKLALSGFLSYRTPVEIDFTAFELACISGHNGAGKSSLLDAFTWALFGEARKRGEELINAASETASVSLTFAYEQNIYRVLRSLTRGKSTVLEFQIQHNNRWRPLTEKTVRATQERIQSTLRMDYDTFVNASFFLQGKADQFAQQKPGDRKRILSSILGLEQWEAYRERAAERRKRVEADLNALESRLEEINRELGEESARRASLQALETQLQQLQTLLKEKEARYRQAEAMQKLLEKQRQQVEMQEAALARSRRERDMLRSRLQQRETESAAQTALLERAAEIESRYQAWQAARESLSRWESLFARFREAEARRRPLLESLRAEEARLDQERQTLHQQQAALHKQRSDIEAWTAQLNQAQKDLAEAEARLLRRAQLEQERGEARETLMRLQTENNALQTEMKALRARLDQISAIEGAACPLCGQPLSAEHRAALQEQIKAEGTEKGDRYRANRQIIESLQDRLRSLEQETAALTSAEGERSRLTALCASLQQRLQTAEQEAARWQAEGAPRLAEIERLLSSQSFAPEIRTRLTAIDQELQEMGYDPAAHEAERRAEQEGRAAEEEYRALESARAQSGLLEREINDLRMQIERLETEIAAQEDAYAEAVAALQQDEDQAPDLEQAEDEFYALKEQESDLNQQVGAARQKVNVLEELRLRKKQLEAERAALALNISRLKTLERAFGKDGVPALLIEQALPQIEEKANELLERLSNGTMRVRFVTQTGYKDRKREDLKETLDIQISDGADTRDYEMFSGGEAFRVNFAIRLALAKTLAQRANARLQTLFIDEGFGSQDALGRQRLVEAINAVRSDFAKILVITHLDELKDAFPNRIEVEKTLAGSSVRVL